MKKTINYLILLTVSIILFAGCSNMEKKTIEESHTISTEVQHTATITLQEDGKELVEKEVSFIKGQNLLTILQENFSVEEDQGFITSIEGHQQNKKAQRYWMFSVDGKSAKVGAKEIILKDDQKIVFNLAKI
ncbi:hypothetical protein A5844_000050 [Enterococcus sp. 10A9_DIV0425]|uniref:Transcobalamin-like C-terminal domain-containing protein n=1 Tax=Candidatus Enterococcus wittei TaxID=1987383 RepID=A0A2C9XQZ4_9ENTE|nr:DUF4430 domain-containing protein [Enterococcus sp. 10A9_DIV0425]OTP11836.1 hypothetical protein A5844_000050 [Enterococcus sp. 10A9_DIV0425]THE14062.1 DUF4430 domain-containing protein [Enterococcus hirae]